MAMIYPDEAKWVNLTKEDQPKSVLGYYQYTEASPNSKFNSKYHSFIEKGTGQLINVSGSTAMDNRLFELNEKVGLVGVLVEVRYKGQTTSKSGATYHDFSIGYDLEDRMKASDVAVDSTPEVKQVTQAPVQTPSTPASKPAANQSASAKAPVSNNVPTFGEDDENDDPFA